MTRASAKEVARSNLLQKERPSLVKHASFSNKQTSFKTLLKHKDMRWIRAPYGAFSLFVTSLNTCVTSYSAIPQIFSISNSSVSYLCKFVSNLKPQLGFHEVCPWRWPQLNDINKATSPEKLESYASSQKRLHYFWGTCWRKHPFFTNVKHKAYISLF